MCKNGGDSGGGGDCRVVVNEGLQKGEGEQREGGNSKRKG